MRFSDIVDHLANRGFVTREQWGNPDCLCYDANGIGWVVRKIEQEKDENGNINRLSPTLSRSKWVPCLEDINAEDWKILDMYWNQIKG